MRIIFNLLVFVQVHVRHTSKTYIQNVSKKFYVKAREKIYGNCVYSPYLESGANSDCNNEGGGGLTLRYHPRKVVLCYYPESSRPNFSNVP